MSSKQSEATKRFPLLDSNSIHMTRNDQDNPDYVAHMMVWTPEYETYMGPVKIWRSEKNERHFSISFQSLHTNEQLIEKADHFLRKYSESPTVPLVDRILIKSVLKDNISWNTFAGAAEKSNVIDEILTLACAEVFNNNAALYFYEPSEADERIQQLTHIVESLSDDKMSDFTEALHEFFKEFFLRVLQDDGSVVWEDSSVAKYEELLSVLEAL